MKRSQLQRRTPLRAVSAAPVCAKCGAAITIHSRSGLCRPCATSAWRRKDPDAPLNPHGQSCVQKRCVICDQEFLTPPSGASKRKTCSIECASLLKRQKGGDHRKGKANPNYRTGKRVGERNRAAEQIWFASAAEACMSPTCKGRSSNLDLHHICYRQHLRPVGGDIWDARNALTLCRPCHRAHHNRSRVLLLSCIPPAAFEFAFETFGYFGVDYLRRYYEDDLLPSEVAA